MTKNRRNTPRQFTIASCAQSNFTLFKAQLITPGRNNQAIVKNLLLGGEAENGR